MHEGLQHKATEYIMFRLALPQTDWDDIHQHVGLVILKMLATQWKPEKGAFSTYFTASYKRSATRWACNALGLKARELYHYKNDFHIEEWTTEKPNDTFSRNELFPDNEHPRDHLSKAIPELFSEVQLASLNTTLDEYHMAKHSCMRSHGLLKVAKKSKQSKQRVHQIKNKHIIPTLISQAEKGTLSPHLQAWYEENYSCQSRHALYLSTLKPMAV